eukprot:760348-Hanusia_phi.AAC.1
MISAPFLALVFAAMKPVPVVHPVMTAVLSESDGRSSSRLWNYLVSLCAGVEYERPILSCHRQGQSC